MIEVTTASGYDAKIDPEVLDDWDFMSAIADADSGETGKALRAQIYICKALLGEEGEKRLKEHVRKVHGTKKAKASDVMNEVIEIFSLIKNSKKSEPSPE